MKKTPLTTGLLLLTLAGTASAQSPIKILNPGFTDGAGTDATSWTLVNGGGTNSAPSNYAATGVPQMTGRTMQLKSDGSNYIQQPLTATTADVPVNASSYGTWSVSLSKGYRRDAVRNGDHTLRVALWNTTANAELVGSDVLIPDPMTTGANSLAPATVTLSYDNTLPALSGAGIALRITSTSGDLAGNAWQRTVILDDVSVTGGVVDPRLDLAPVSTFSNNGAPGTFTLNFSNGGATQNLVVSGVTLEGTDAAAFTVNSFSASTAPGASGQIQLGFTPVGPGPYSADVVIASNSSGTPSITVPIAVNVVDPVLQAGTGFVDFGSLAANPGAQSLNLQLSNTGGAETLEILDVTFLGSTDGGFSIVSAPTSIAPSGNQNLVVGFNPGSATGDFGDILRIETNSMVEPVKFIPVKAKVAFTTAPKPVQVLNADFNANSWNSANGGSPTNWLSSKATGNQAGNYGHGATGIGGAFTPNLTSNAAHLQAAGGYYEQSLSANNAGLTAGGAGTVSVTLDAGYRNDSITSGDILLRVGLWDSANGVEITGRDMLILDTGVLTGTASNQLSPVQLGLSYDAGTYTTEQLALRITQILPALPAAAVWHATAIIDNVSVSVDGTWEPSSGYAGWALASGLDGTPGKESGPADDPDHDGVSNFEEFALGGSPLSGASGALVAAVAADTNANTSREWVITAAVRTGANFSGSPSPEATIDGIHYTVQGSTALSNFTATVEGPLATPVIPAALPASPPAGYEYRSFRLQGSEDLPGSGFLRVQAVPQS